jgi:hypothetical protein
MNEQLRKQIDKEISPYLSKDEDVKSVGFFRKVPATRKLILTRGLARFFSQEFLAALTEKRMILVPVNKINGKTVYGDAWDIDLKDVKFGNSLFSDLVLQVGIAGSRHRLRLRFEYGSSTNRSEKDYFMAALLNAQQA